MFNRLISGTYSVVPAPVLQLRRSTYNNNAPGVELEPVTTAPPLHGN